MSKFNNVVIFPLILSLWIPGLILVCYVQGIIFVHYTPLLPLISDTGGYPPEAGVFSFALSMCGFLIWIIMLIRHIQLDAIINSAYLPLILDKDPLDEHATDNERRLKLAKIDRIAIRLTYVEWFGFLIGIITGFACVATGSFRFTESALVHMALSFGLIGGINLCMIMQTYISYLFMPIVNSKSIFVQRLLITIFNSVALLIAAIMLTVRLREIGTEYFNPITRLFLKEDNQGYSTQLTMAISQWLFILSISPFILTFCPEFRRLNFRKLEIEYKFYC